MTPAARIHRWRVVTRTGVCTLLAPSIVAAAVPTAQHEPWAPAFACVHSAMTRLLHIGAAPERAATVALHLCHDAIEAIAAAGPDASEGGRRAAVRRELFEYALGSAGHHPTCAECRDPAVPTLGTDQP